MNKILLIAWIFVFINVLTSALILGYTTPVQTLVGINALVISTMMIIRYADRLESTK